MDDDTVDHDRDRAESIRQMDERWRYDNESIDADEEQRVVIDNYEER